MLRVGITGGIGSGKSAVANRFEKLGIKVVDADVASRAVVLPGSDALAAIAEHFGHDVLLNDGSLDRAALRQRIFAEPEERLWLEALLHPLIDRYIKQELASAGSSPYVILVSPLLIESGQRRYVDRILVVDVPEALQLERVVQRDANSRDQVKAIMAAQASREARLKAADDVILNDDGFSKLDAEVARLHTAYLTMAETSK